MIQADDRLKGLFDEAIKIARNNKHEYITLEHLLLVLILQPEIIDMVKDKPTVKADQLVKDLEHHIAKKMNDIKVKENFNFKQSAKDLLITSQLRTALIIDKEIKSTNYQIDTYKKKIYIYGIAMTSNEKEKVIDEAKQILDVKDVVASILLVENLRIQKN